MTSPRQAREELGRRLREIRRDAELTGRRLAQLSGWHESKVSKIENGTRPPNEADLRAYAAHTGTADQLPDLIATLRGIEAAYIEWRRLLATGTRRRQERSVTLAEETRLQRVYEPQIIPGIFQTPEYAEQILRRAVRFYGIPDDVDAGVSKRIERQQWLYRGDRRFHVLVTEQAIYNPVGGPGVHRGQLDRLLSVSGLPRVILGVIPASAPMPMQSTNFVVFDSRLVLVETPTAELSITQPREIETFSRLFAELSEASVTGEPARRLIRLAIDTRSR
ncbi:helix-turn-helix domain-containing protein [Nocardia sp. NPDC058633]|uniref:helix-turn-helix domain-containing protein n=1 Tax=Nocardia sp. NPDC058633 TaxID=3346568 RepID=UPI0036527C7A